MELSGKLTGGKLERIIVISNNTSQAFQRTFEKFK